METSHTSTIDLNNTDPQVVYEHDGGNSSDFTPTRIMIKRHSGPLAGEAPQPITLIFEDTGPMLLREQIALSGLDDGYAVLHRFVQRSGKLSIGQQVRVRPDAAYGDEAYVSVTVFGV